MELLWKSVISRLDCAFLFPCALCLFQGKLHVLLCCSEHKPRLSCFLCQLNVSSALVRGMWGSVKPWWRWERWGGLGDGHSPAVSAVVPRAGSQVKHSVWGNHCCGKWENPKLQCSHWCMQSFQTTNTSEPCSSCAYPWISVSVHTALVASTQGGTSSHGCWGVRMEHTDLASLFILCSFPNPVIFNITWVEEYLPLD